MNYKTAEKLLEEDYQSMSLEKLQKYRVKLIDAVRESGAEYGMKQALENGFYVTTLDGVRDFVPKDLWLHRNLCQRFNMVLEREQKIYSTLNID